MRSDERGALGYKSTIRNPIIAIVVVILLVPLITSTVYYKVLSPFSLPDLSFALFFLLLAISCMLSYLLLKFEKSLALQPLLKAAFPVNATIFQLAYFSLNLYFLTKDKYMKIEEHRGIWSKIQQFPLDDPNAAITFSHKLAATQNWSPDFTARVVEEYRKFLFLCCISPNGASPSQTVDEVWHLHLTYTKSYWTDLCKNTLNINIHHNPSQGGDEEDHKHREWYAETLLLYESVFGTPPPDDIWPPPKMELPIPEPAWHLRNEMIVLFVILLSLPLIISAIRHDVLFPFALPGPQFLVFFPLLALSCIICHIILQYDRNRPLQQLVVEHFPTDATIFQTALLYYGKHRSVQTGIVDLIRRNLLSVSSDEVFTLHKNRYQKLVNEQNPLIAGFLNEERETVEYSTIASVWYREEYIRHPALQKLRSLAQCKESFLKKYNLLLIPFAVCIIRFFQGMYNSKPVTYLFGEMLALVAVTVLVQVTTSRYAIVLSKIKELIHDPFGAVLRYDDEVVLSYARGKNSIEVFAEGLLLVTIFTPWASLDHNNPLPKPGDGGGGCGSSCGGGCGGGCGGCGS
ncbi:MAG: glycine-rich domain-containing protein [Niastella sp.]|uniref:glycine-rich domain-containing protein n=1 Tax=Niastella sp. TaxID=1869183 RepID=UPI003899BD0B